jgi:hypothetical protein
MLLDGEDVLAAVVRTDPAGASEPPIRPALTGPLRKEADENRFEEETHGLGLSSFFFSGPRREHLCETGC